MSFYEELDFFIYLLFALIPAIILKAKGKSLSRYILGVSIFFLLLLFRNNLVQLLYFVLYIGWEITLVFSYSCLNKRYPRKRNIYILTMFFSLFPLAICKVSGIFGESIFGFIGISYISFKVIQIIIEIYDGVIKEIKLFDTLNFLVFFPTFTSGPIDRSRRFTDDIHRDIEKKDYYTMVGIGMQKICLGVLYKFALSAIAFHYLNSVFANRLSPLYVLGYAYTYGIYMFFDFAGYSLMAIGVSYVLGIRTPDNFRMPFISKNITDFWNRWHISLSTWFRDFVFSRFMISSIRAKRFKNRITTAQVGLIINMLIMGVWHGLSLSYIAYGLYHGILLAISEKYHKESKFYKKNKNKKLYYFASWFVTINLVMFGFLIFSGCAKTLICEYFKILF